MKLLQLAVKEPYFTIMEIGEKDFELRDPTKFIKDRLGHDPYNPIKYDGVQIVNGYGLDRPWFIAKFEGYGTGYDCSWTFSNGLFLNANKHQYVIFLGPIIERQNIDPARPNLVIKKKWAHLTSKY